jgi:hypothetical protein
MHHIKENRSLQYSTEIDERTVDFDVWKEAAGMIIDIAEYYTYAHVKWWKH